jgi:hypothetical protein
MACPMTAGVAAVLMSSFPELSNLDIKNVLIESSKKSMALEDYVMSEGQLNALGAYNFVKNMTGFTVIPSKLFIKKGDTYKLSSFGDFGSVTYSVDDEILAKVSGDGVVEGLSDGEVTVTAKSADGSIETVSVQVFAPSSNPAPNPPGGCGLRNESHDFKAGTDASFYLMLLPLVLLGLVRVRKD